MKNKIPTFVLLTVFLSLSAVPAHAALITQGAVFPGSVTSGTANSQVFVGYSNSDGTLTINSSTGGNGITELTTSNTGGGGIVAGVGNLGDVIGTVNVIGDGTAGSASINMPNKSIDLGTDLGSAGVLNVYNGASVYAGWLTVGARNGANGAVTVHGEGSLIEIADEFGGITVWFGSELGRTGVLVRDGGRIAALDGMYEGVIAIGANYAPPSEALVTLNNEGTLQGAVEIQQNGILQGDGGIVDGELRLFGGTLSPGLSPGTLNITGDANLLDGLLQLEWDSPTSYDVLNIGGALTLGADLMIDLVFSDIAPTVIDLADFFNASSFDIGAFDFGTQFSASFAPGYTGSGTASVSFFGGEIYTVSNAVSIPEPPMSALFALGFLGYLFKKRRQIR